MKLPTTEAISKGSMMANMDFIGPIELFMDYGLSLQEIVEKEFNIPPLQYLIDEKVPFKDQQGKEGWFLIKALTIAIRCPFCNNKTNIPNFILVGYMENNKFLGLIKETKGCTSCPDCGFYIIYPKSLIDIILNEAENKKIKTLYNKPLDEILKQEKEKIIQ